MYRSFALFWVLLFASIPAHADPAARAFTEKVAQAVAMRLPDLAVTPDGHLALSVTRKNGNKVSVSLTNRYHDYKSNPANFGAIVDLVVGSLDDKVFAAPGKPDRTRIVPVIKHRAWLDEVRQDIKKSGSAQDVLFEEFNKELVVIYAEDSEKRMRFLLSSDDIGVERKELRKLAVDNLARILPKIEMQGDDVFAMITAGGDYEASLLLFDDIWSGGQIKVEGDIVVAVPAKNVLLITGSQNRKGLAAARWPPSS
jgi:uncharacterized protein YtpQ (UPF0354 family)